MALFPGKKLKILNVILPAKAAGMRLDQFLSELPEIASRTYAAKLIESGNVLLSGQQQSKNHKIKGGEQLKITIPPPQELDLQPEDVPFKLLFEDDDLAVISKPAGVVVHPSPGHLVHTLVHGLLGRLELSSIGGVERPGIIHRLDKDTSGLLIIAKNDQSHQTLSRELKDRLIKREYIALVKGQIKQQAGSIDAPIGRHPKHRKKMAVVEGTRHARTFWRVKERFDRFTLLELELETGRTHQIRVHMAHINHPVAGDPLYGGKDTFLESAGLNRQFLHAAKLRLKHPKTREELYFEDPLPPDLAMVLEQLSGRP